MSQERTTSSIEPSRKAETTEGSQESQVQTLPTATAMQVESPSMIEGKGSEHELVAEPDHGETSQEGQIPIQICVRCRSQLMSAGNPSGNPIDPLEEYVDRKLISDHSMFSHLIGPTNFLPTVDFEEFAEYEAGQMNMVDNFFSAFSGN